MLQSEPNARMEEIEEINARQEAFRDTRYKEVINNMTDHCSVLS